MNAVLVLRSVKCLTCSLMLLMPSGPSKFTACLTRSVRPQFSILKPRSCRNLASVEAASSFLVAQKQSSALRMEITASITVMNGKLILRSVNATSLTLFVAVHSPRQGAAAWQPASHHHCPQRSCTGAQCGPLPPGSTPSVEAALEMACRNQPDQIRSD